MLYPTTSGGREWFADWSIVGDPLSPGERDPNDPEFFSYGGLYRNDDYGRRKAKNDRRLAKIHDS